MTDVLSILALPEFSVDQSTLLHFARFIIISILLLGLVWLLEKTKAIKSSLTAEYAWKAALLGCFIALIPLPNLNPGNVVVTADIISQVEQGLHATPEFLKNKERASKELPPTDRAQFLDSPAVHEEAGTNAQLSHSSYNDARDLAEMPDRQTDPVTPPAPVPTSTPGNSIGGREVAEQYIAPPLTSAPSKQTTLSPGLEATYEPAEVEQTAIRTLDLISVLWISIATVALVSLLIRYHFTFRMLGKRTQLGDSHRASMILKRLRNKAKIRGQVYLSQSNHIVSPVCVPHIFRPKGEICLPNWIDNTVSDQQLESLIAHELGHIVRRDPVMLLVLKTISILAFFQPMFRIAEKRLLTLAEFSADLWAAEITGEPKKLAETLYVCAAKLNKNSKTGLSFAMADDRSLLRQRVDALIGSYQGLSYRYRLMARLSALTLAITATLAFPTISVLETPTNNALAADEELEPDHEDILSEVVDDGQAEENDLVTSSTTLELADTYLAKETHLPQSPTPEIVKDANSFPAPLSKPLVTLVTPLINNPEGEEIFAPNEDKIETVDKAARHLEIDNIKTAETISNEQLKPLKNTPLPNAPIGIVGEVVYTPTLARDIKALNLFENKREKKPKRLYFLKHEIFDDLEEFEFAQITKRLIDEGLRRRYIHTARYQLILNKVRIYNHPSGRITTGEGANSYGPLKGSGTRAQAMLQIYNDLNEIVYEDVLHVTQHNYNQEDYRQNGYSKFRNGKGGQFISVILANEVARKIYNVLGPQTPSPGILGAVSYGHKVVDHVERLNRIQKHESSDYIDHPLFAYVDEYDLAIVLKKLIDANLVRRGVNLVHYDLVVESIRVLRYNEPRFASTGRSKASQAKGVLTIYDDSGSIVAKHNIDTWFNGDMSFKTALHGYDKEDFFRFGYERTKSGSRREEFMNTLTSVFANEVARVVKETLMSLASKGAEKSQLIGLDSTLDNGSTGYGSNLTNVVYTPKLARDIKSFNVFENQKRYRYKRLPFLDHEAFDGIEDFELSQAIQVLVDDGLKQRGIQGVTTTITLRELKMVSHPARRFSSYIGKAREGVRFELKDDGRLNIKLGTYNGYIEATLIVRNQSGKTIAEEDLDISISNHNKADYQKYGYGGFEGGPAKLLTAIFANEVAAKIASIHRENSNNQGLAFPKININTSPDSQINGRVGYTDTLKKIIGRFNKWEHGVRSPEGEIPVFLAKPVFNGLERFDFAKIVHALVDNGLTRRNVKHANYSIELKKIRVSGYTLNRFSAGDNSFPSFSFSPDRSGVRGSPFGSRIEATLRICDIGGNIILDKEIKFRPKNGNIEDYRENGYTAFSERGAKGLIAFFANEVALQIIKNLPEDSVNSDEAGSGLEDLEPKQIALNH